MSKEFPDLKIHSQEGDLPHILVFFIIVNRFQLWKVFHDLSDFGCTILVLGAFGAHMPGLPTTEAESFLHGFLAFFSHKLSYFDDVHIHGVWVSSFGGIGEGLVGLMSGSRILFGDFIGAFPLGLEGNGLLIPAVNGSGDGVHGHNLAHEGGRDASREVPDEDILVSDFGEGGIVFEVGYIFNEGRGIGIVFPLGHVFGGKPGDGGSSGIVVFERGFELCDKVGESSHSYGGS